MYTAQSISLVASSPSQTPRTLDVNSLALRVAPRPNGAVSKMQLPCLTAYVGLIGESRTGEHIYSKSV